MCSLDELATAEAQYDAWQAERAAQATAQEERRRQELRRVAARMVEADKRARYVASKGAVFNRMLYLMD